MALRARMSSIYMSWRECDLCASGGLVVVFRGTLSHRGLCVDLRNVERKRRLQMFHEPSAFRPVKGASDLSAESNLELRIGARGAFGFKRYGSIQPFGNSER